MNLFHSFYTIYKQPFDYKIQNQNFDFLQELISIAWKIGPCKLLSVFIIMITHFNMGK